jgi:hypothetical protein
MLRTVRCALGVGLLCAVTAQASTTFIDFNQDPIAEGKVTSITGSGFSGGQWLSYGGIGYSTNSSDGYLQITAAVNGQNGKAIFPDFDGGAVVQGFAFDCMVRVGNGRNPDDGSTTPADGFSISYARAGDPALTGDAWNGNGQEEGTRTGVAIGFDCYENSADDPRAIDIWVDGVQILKSPMPTINGALTDPTSLQTGPADASGTSDGLGWAHLVVNLDTSGLLNVYYKGAQLLTNYPTGYVPGPGQLVMAGRTGGLNEFQDVDNITITTTVAQNVTAGSTATGLGDGVSVPFFDSGAGVVDTTKPATVSIDGAPAVPASAVVKQGTTTQVIYYGYPTLLVPGSAHHVVATVTDVFGRVTTSSSLPFTVGAYSTVNSALAVTGVNTATKGFRIKPWQSGIEPNNYWWANEQLVGLHGAINPLCDLTGAINGYFNYTGVINFDYTNNAGTMGQNGSFQLSNGYEATQLPGIVTDPNLSGTPANTNVDNCALEILSFLHFQNPGVYTMGVISDDGFNVTVGTNPADWGAQSVGSFNGGRGADAGTIFTFIIPAAGYYPFRLVWENGGGGANVEWFVVQPGGTKILVNDPSPTNTTGVTAYYGGPALPAFVSDLVPWPDSTTYQADQFKAMVTDLATTVTAGTLTLSLDGAPVSAVSSQNAGVTTISVGSGYLLPLGKHTGRLVYSTSAGTFTNTWNFTVANYLVPTWAVTGVDTSKSGFLLKPYQSYVWPNSYGAQPNTVRYTLEQLAGLHGPNAANLTTATDGGFIDYFADPSGTPNGLINFNMSGSGGAGNFADDRGIPGLTLGTDVPDSGNQSIDVVAFLQFDQAGVYTMGINSDDGFAVYAGANPRDWTTATLLGQFDGGRGPADTTFSIYVPTAGIYPIRMIYYNGNNGVAAGNGAACEWFVVQPDGTKILLNDPAPVQDTHVKAFYKGPALPAFVSAFCPANGATGVSQVGAAAGLSTTAFGVQLTDGSTTVTPGTIAVSINGVPRTPTVSPKVNGITTVTLPGFLPAGTNTAELVYSTSGGGPFTFTWNFTVASNTLPIVKSAWAVTGVDTTKQGFRYRPWQSGAQNNTVWWTEEQLAGFHGPNNADLSILNDGNYYDYIGVPNFDIGGGGNGDFTASRNGYTDINFPGIPGANNVTDNSAIEMLTFLQFNQVGVYSMCVNSDDGFKVTVGPNPMDWFALNVGQYDGGRGAGINGGTTFSFIITNAGYYPFRLIWENGGGGCNVEWTMVQPDGSRILINDPNAPESTQVTAYYKGPALAPGITAVTPTPGTSGDLGGLQVKLADGNPPVTTNSITLTIDGVAVTPTLLYGPGATTITYDKLAAGAHTAVLCYSTSAGGPFCTTWNFTTTPAPNGGLVLSTNLWTPPGSGSNPGFAVKVFQTANTNILNGWQNNTRMADMMLQGLYGPSVADLTDYTNNGAMWWPGVINFSQNDTAALTANGNFRTTTYPDAAIPGLGVWDPTLVGLTQPRMDRDAMEVKAFLEFASPGYYVMGVNSDDGFRVTEGDQGAPGKSPLALLAPAGVAGEMTAMYTTQADGDGNRGFGGTPSSTTPIIRRVVAANPITVNGALVNASALQGNIALVARGDGIGFAVKAKAAQDAGAVAVIIANNLDNDTPANEFPGTLGGADATVTIPCLQVNYRNGTNLIAQATTDTSSPLIARITAQDCSPIVGYIDIGKGASDVLFGFTVPQAGVYPFRLVWENGNGDANCEWFIRDPVLGTYLVNQPGSPVKAWITRDVHAAGALPAPKLNTPTLSGGKVIISWTGEGELWESYSLNGPWFKSTYQANPSAVTPSSVLKASFFRVRQY